VSRRDEPSGIWAMLCMLSCSQTDLVITHMIQWIMSAPVIYKWCNSYTVFWTRFFSSRFFCTYINRVKFLHIVGNSTSSGQSHVATPVTTRYVDTLSNRLAIACTRKKNHNFFPQLFCYTRQQLFGWPRSVWRQGVSLSLICNT